MKLSADTATTLPFLKFGDRKALLAGYNLPSARPGEFSTATALLIHYLTGIVSEFKVQVLEAGLLWVVVDGSSLGLNLVSKGLATIDDDTIGLLGEAEMSEAKQKAAFKPELWQPLVKLPQNLVGLKGDFFIGEEFAVCPELQLSIPIECAYLEYSFPPGQFYLVIERICFDPVREARYALVSSQDLLVEKQLVQEGRQKLQSKLECVPALLAQAQQSAIQKSRGKWQKQSCRSISLVGRNYIEGVIQEVISTSEFLLRKEDKSLVRLLLSKVECLTPFQNYEYQALALLRKELVGHQFRFFVQHDMEFKKRGTLLRLGDYANISRMLIEQGLARVLPSFVKQKRPEAAQLLELQRGAEANKRGIFSGKQSSSRVVTYLDKSTSEFSLCWPELLRELRTRAQHRCMLLKMISAHVYQILLIDKKKAVRFRVLGLRHPYLWNPAPHVSQVEAAFRQYFNVNLQQRQFLVSFSEEVDMNERAFLGKIVMGKSELGDLLLGEGFAFLDKSQYFSRKSAEAEKSAKQKEKGIWRKPHYFLENVGLLSVYVESFVFKGTFTVADSPRQIYVQNQANRGLINKIQADLVGAKKQTPKSIVVGGLYGCKYSQDQQYYRAIVLKDYKSKFLVRYVDYGNQESVELKDLIQLPDGLAQIAYMALRVELCGCKFSTNKLYHEELLAEYLIDVTMDIRVKSVQIGPRHCAKVLAYSEARSVNELLLEGGACRTQSLELQFCSEQQAARLLQAERVGRRAGLGVWQQEQMDYDSLSEKIYPKSDYVFL